MKIGDVYMTKEAFQDKWDEIAANCWGCGRNNDLGLQIKSYWEGDEAVCIWQPKEHHLAFQGILNGGIIASIIDCHCLNTANAAYIKEKDLGWDILAGGFVTGTLNVKYIRPTPVSEPVKLIARVTEFLEKKIKVSCELYSNNNLCATGGITAVKFS